MNPRGRTATHPPPRGHRFLSALKVPFYFGFCLGRPELYYAWKAFGFRLLGGLRCYERRSMAVLTAALPRGGWAVDVGGHFGVYTRAFLQAAGPDGGVVVIEPFPPAAQRLARTLGRAPNCRVMPFAASERSGETVVLRVPRLHRIVPEPALARVDQSGGLTRGIEAVVPVTTIALDDLFPELPRLDVVKIDTEGHELSVLAGSRHLLARFRPLVQFEEHCPERLPREYAALAAELQYVVAGADPQGRLVELTGTPQKPGEYYLTPREQLA